MSCSCGNVPCTCQTLASCPCGNNPCTCAATGVITGAGASINSYINTTSPWVLASTSMSTISVPTGMQGNIIITDGTCAGNIAMAKEKYVHVYFDPRSEAHMAAYEHLCEKGSWPEDFIAEMTSYGVPMGEPAIWRDLLDLKIHKVHGGFCANREQLLLDFLTWAEASDTFLSTQDQPAPDTEARYVPLDDAEAAELVRTYLASLR